MGEFALQHLHVYPLRWGEISELSEDQRAIFSMVSFAVSEINSLRRLAIFSLPTVEDHPDVEHAAAIQRNVLLRVMVSKLFEFIKFFNTIEKNNKNDNIINGLINDFSDEKNKLLEGKGYEVAKHIRNKITNHYDIDMTKKSLSNIPDEQNCNLYLADEQGNSYYPIGETVVFAGSLSTEGKVYTLRGAEDLDYLIDWSMTVSDLMNKFHVALFDKIIDPLFPQRKVRQKVEWLPRNLVGSSEGYRLPVFIRGTP